jgi:nucleoside permease NupC
MPLHVRPIAVTIAVIAFFGISLIGCISGLSPSTCSKRAAIGALATYVVVAFAVRAVNSILTNAIITEQVQVKEKQEEKVSDVKD